MPAHLEGSGVDPGTRLGRLFDTHHQRLFRLACRLSRRSEDAHDLVQETFLRAARSPHSIPEGPSSEEAWLVRVLVNLSRDRWRAAAVRRRAAADGTLDPAAGSHPEPALLARTIVRDALQRIAPRRRAILVLYELEGMPIKEIAALLGVNAVTVRWHLSVGRREMATAIDAGRTR